MLKSGTVVSLTPLSVENFCDAREHDAAHPAGRGGNSGVRLNNRKPLPQSSPGMEGDPGNDSESFGFSNKRLLIQRKYELL